MKRDYLVLLARRESKEMLGHRLSNLWILTAVLFVAFMAVAFSWAGKKYLEYKMADPFTNWVNISNDFGKGEYDRFFSDLESSELRDSFQISNVSGDDYLPTYVVGKDGKEKYLEFRFFGDFEGGLVSAVLDKKNVVDGCSLDLGQVTNNTFGLIITQDALCKLGYSLDSVPAFINISNPAGDDLSLGMDLHELNGTYYSMDPMPLLGVVKSLPMNMDLIGSQFWYVQYLDDTTNPYFINDAKYFAKDQLYYYVEEGLDSAFIQTVTSLPHGTYKTPKVYLCEDGIPSLQPWKKGNFYQVMFGTASTPVEDRAEFDRTVQSAFTEMGVTRVYYYDEAYAERDNNYQYYSVNFNDLKSISDFAGYVKQEYGIQIEISQVTSKQNFKIVSTIANVLTAVMIVFAMICIIMYIINMLQGYFQKVKRNLGTFKAFGMESDSLIRVYVLTLLVIIAVAILTALIVTGIIGLVLRMTNVVWDQGFPYFVLFNRYTLISVCVVLLSTVITTWAVMKKQFQRTPGDLIYDR